VCVTVLIMKIIVGGQFKEEGVRREEQRLMMGEEGEGEGRGGRKEGEEKSKRKKGRNEEGSG
jgi:hypothetical protein